MGQWDKEVRTTTRRNKAGEVSVLELKKLGFKSLVVSGKIKLSSFNFSLTNYLSYILSIGKDFLRLFPFLDQATSSFILSYTPHLMGNSNTITSVSYEFTYTMNNGSIDKNAAIQLVLSKNDYIEKEFNSYMSKVLQE